MRQIDDEGLDLEIQCLLCTNPMKSDRGCDGGCMVNERVYKKILAALDRRMTSVKGKWIDKGRWLECSVCHRTIHKSIIYGPYRISVNHCPVCGADNTRKVEDDGEAG